MQNTNFLISMGSINEENSSATKPKIDLLLEEINEVRHRENEYLAHIRSIYSEKKNSCENELENVIENHLLKNDSSTEDNVKENSKLNRLTLHHLPTSNNPNSVKFAHAVSSKSGSSKKGIMHQFYTSRGKLMKDQYKNNFLSSTEIAALADYSPTKIERDDFGKPIRKGFIPVEEKIYQELKDLQNRERELKLLRQENSNTKNDVMDEFHFEYDCKKLGQSKSIGELYQTIWQSKSRSETEEHRKHYPSLAQLCDLHDNDVISSHKLIEKWEFLIQERKQQNIG